MGIPGSATIAVFFCMAYPPVWPRHVLGKILARPFRDVYFYYCCKGSAEAGRRRIRHLSCFSPICFRRLFTFILFISAEHRRSFFLDVDFVSPSPLYSDKEK